MRLWALVLATALLAAACGGTSTTKASQSATGTPIVIGAVFDLSGATADVGTPYAEGVRGYVDWRNRSGGIAGHPIDLRSQDYAYDVAKAEQLYSQLSIGAVAFLGWGTGDTEALRARITADKIPFMSGSYSANLADPKQTPYNFVVAPTYSTQMNAALDHIAKEAGNQKAQVAVFHHDSPFGQSPLKDGEAHIKSANLNLGFKAYPMPRGATSYDGQLAQAKDQGAGYIVVQNVSSPAATLAKNVQEQGLSMQTTCLNWCADEQFVTLAGAAANGAFGVAPFAPPTVNAPGMAEPRDYLQSKGQSLDKQGVHYLQGWYTMALMSKGVEEALKKGGQLTGTAIKDALEAMPAFDTGGVSPPIDFSATDHQGMKVAPLYEVKNAKWEKAS